VRYDLNDRLRKLEAKERSAEPVELAPPPHPVEFARACSIVQKEGESVTGLIPFDLWPEQERALIEMEEARRAGKWVIAVKGRQIGFTWLDLVYWLYHGTFWSNRLFLLARQSEAYAMDAIERVRVLRSGLPPEWKVPLVTDNLTMLRFANGCKFEALTATKRLGRGLAAFGFLADEFAFWDWQADQQAAFESAASNVHIVTTGNGADLTEVIWNDAVAGRGRYVPIFIPSSADPRRDDEWRVRNVDQSAHPRLAKREHAETPEDAFSSPEGVYFERWDPQEYVQEFSFDRARRTYVGIDFGWVKAAIVFAQTTTQDDIMVFDEYIAEREKVSEWAAEVKARLELYDSNYTLTDAYGDPAGRARSAQTATSDVEVFEMSTGFSFHGEPAGVRDGCVRLTERIGDPERPLLVHPRCTELVAALNTIKPDKSKPDLYDERSPFTHVLDALRYLVWNIDQQPGHFDIVPSDRPITAGLYGREW
jgi:hypothetical protein